MEDLRSCSNCGDANRRRSELHFLVLQAQQKKEKRRLVIATLEALVGSSPDRSTRTEPVEVTESLVADPRSAAT
jgi:hypothetical protein